MFETIDPRVFALCIITVAFFGGAKVFLKLRRRFVLIGDTKKYIVTAKREALFGNFARAATKLRIAARISPVAIDKLGLDTDTLQWAKIVAQQNLRCSEGKDFYV